MVRQRLVRIAHDLGATGLLARLARRRGLLVLAYHRIGLVDGHDFDDELFSATPDDFRQQIRFLATHFDVLSADALVQVLRNGRLDLTRPSALITFDDGYRDNCEVAMPILKEQGVSAVFFVAAGYVDTPRLTWWDRVAYVIKRTSRPALDLAYPEPVRVDIRTMGRARATYVLLRLYKRTPAIDPLRFFAELESQAGVPVDSTALGRDAFMTWDHVRRLAGAGMEIGAHTYDHPILARLPQSAQRHELHHSKVRLEAETSCEVKLMSYPVGGHGAFTADTERLAQETGYSAAFSYYGGFNRRGPIDRFNLRRVAIERCDSFATFCVRTSTCNLFGRGLV